MTLKIRPVQWRLDADGKKRAFGRTPYTITGPTLPKNKLRVLGLRSGSTFTGGGGGGGIIVPGNVYPSFGSLAILKPADEVAAGRAVWFDSLLSSSDLATVAIGTEPDGGRIRSWGPDVFQAIVNRVPSGKKIAFEAGVEEIDSTVNWTGAGAVRVPGWCAGMVGNEPPGTSWDNILPTTRRTCFRIKANSSGTNNVAGSWFQCGFSGSIRSDYANIHFEGTEQGMQTAGGGNVGQPGIDGTSHRVFTNFYVWNQAPGGTARDILSTGWSGTNGAPPGETFGFEWYHSTDAILARVAVDGRRAAGGPIYGSAGITFGYAVRGIAIDCYAHHTGDSGWVNYITYQCDTYNLVLGDRGDRTTVHITRNISNGDGLNHELTNQCRHFKPIYNCYAVNRAQREPISYAGMAASYTQDGLSFTVTDGTIEIIDPTYTGILFSGEIAVGSMNPYGANPSTYGDGAPPPNIHRSDGTKIPFKWDYGSGWMNF